MRVNRMSRARTRTALAAFAVAGLTAGAAAGAGPANAQPKAAPAAPDCSAAYRIEQKLANGTTWRMCWRHEAMAGMVMEDITYQPPGESKPIKVLNSSRLAQIHVPYDDGSEEYDDITSFYFGAGLENLAAGECPGGTIRTVKVRMPGASATENVKGLCTTTRARGHAYRMHDYTMDGTEKLYQKQGKDLLVYAVNKVGWYEYITEWRFSDDGAIHLNVGATGSLAPQDYDAADGRGWPIGKGNKARSLSHSHNVFWKLDFALDGSSKGRVEQYDSKVTPRQPGDRGPTNKTTRTKITKETAGDAKNMRWWRVVSATGKNKDGHPRSYELVAGPNAKYSGRGFTKHDVYFTQYNKCEKYASNNKGNCPSGHPKSVDKWVNGQNLTNPSMWVNVGFHHIARDEDQQPMPVHWQGFSVVPRDVTAMNPLTPAALAGANGRLD
ncbi:copper amine oxidase [Streptomyces sp. GXMU-J15]|uniref:Amine oxidase n=1 Tax=Streptomyces fuscus TaxID=3048495 RepID=A0ABT7JAG4_9ACTN|nr:MULTISPECIES: copper amine oxidase [Streptomyces]MDL2081863.1 copper amine oxidase [Streptomyces fuscus]SBT90910.1 primary-amine oxidase [Streptomyces sp. DI166]